MHCKEYKLGEVCAIIPGVSFRESDYTESEIPVLKVKDIQDGKIQIDNENLLFCNTSSFKKYEKIEPRSIVVANGGTAAGKIGINTTNKILIHNAEIFKVYPRNSNTLNNAYLFHYLRRYEYQIKDLSSSGVISHLYNSAFKNFPILLPPLEIQERMAKTLDIFMSLERRKQQYEYYRDLLIGEPIKIYKNIEIKEYLLEDICEIQKGVSFKASDYIDREDPRCNSPGLIPVLKVKDVRKGKVQTDNLIYCDAQKFGKTTIVNYEDTMIVNFSSGKTGVGRIGINLTNLKLIPTSHLFKIFPIDESVLNKKYLYYFLENKEKEIKDVIPAGSIPVLSKNDLRKLKLRIPPLEIQKDIVKKLDIFSDLSMEGTLKEEIISRRQQYEGYRELLFNKYCKS